MMKALGLPLIACVFAWTVPVAVQDASVEITQAALNKLVQRVGPFSNAGVYKPSSPAGNTGSLFGRCEYVGYLDCPSSLGGHERRPLVKCEVKPTFRRLDGGKGSLASFSKVALIPAADPAVTYEWWIDNPSLAVGSGSMTFTASVRSRVGTQTNTEARTVPAQLAWEPAGGHVRLSVGPFTVPLRIGSTTIVSVDVARYYNLALSIQPQTFSLALPDGSFRQINARPVSGSVQYRPGRVVLNFGLGF